MLNRFRSTVGGEIYNHRDGMSGGRKKSWQWATTRGPLVFDILTAFLPYLGDRRGAKAMEALRDVHKIKGVMRTEDIPLGR